MSERAALRREILDLVRRFHAAEPPCPFRAGEDVVRYAGRWFDDEELVALVDSSLDFWLTAGRYAEELEANLADVLGIESVLLVNSGSSANLVALSALTVMMKSAKVVGTTFWVNLVVALVAMLYSVYALFASGKDAVMGGMLVLGITYVIWGFIAPRFAPAAAMTGRQSTKA